MTFSGIGAPSNDFGYQAKVSHPDLAAGSLWGNLFISFSGEPQSISAGTTLAPTDYNMAYLGYYRQDNGNFDQVALSGSSELQILDVSGLDEEQTRQDGEQTAGSNGDVFVWPTDGDKEVPAPIKYPADHNGWKVVVEGASTKSTHPVGDVQSGDSCYSLTTSLNEGELVESVRLVPSINYEQASEYIQNPGDVTAEQIQNRISQLKTLKQEIKELEDAANNGLGGGLPGLGGLPTLPGLGVVESAIVAALGITGFKALTS
jgi:hypothetical protein